MLISPSILIVILCNVHKGFGEAILTIKNNKKNIIIIIIIKVIIFLNQKKKKHFLYFFLDNSDHQCSGQR